MPQTQAAEDGRVLATHVTTETRHWLLVCAARRITGLIRAGFREDTGGRGGLSTLLQGVRLTNSMTKGVARVYRTPTQSNKVNCYHCATHSGKSLQ